MSWHVTTGIGNKVLEHAREPEQAKITHTEQESVAPEIPTTFTSDEELPPEKLVLTDTQRHTGASTASDFAMPTPSMPPMQAQARPAAPTAAVAGGDHQVRPPPTSHSGEDSESPERSPGGKGRFAKLVRQLGFLIASAGMYSGVQMTWDGTVGMVASPAPPSSPSSGIVGISSVSSVASGRSSPAPIPRPEGGLKAAAKAVGGMLSVGAVLVLGQRLMNGQFGPTEPKQRNALRMLIEDKARAFGQQPREHEARAPAGRLRSLAGTPRVSLIMSDRHLGSQGQWEKMGEGAREAEAQGTTPGAQASPVLTTDVAAQVDGAAATARAAETSGGMRGTSPAAAAAPPAVAPLSVDEEDEEASSPSATRGAPTPVVPLRADADGGDATDTAALPPGAHSPGHAALIADHVAHAADHVAPGEGAVSASGAGQVRQMIKDFGDKFGVDTAVYESQKMTLWLKG